ncbi:trafficking kinesin-binding protein milt-like [Tigriopus californicus]|uniref:trafficking kinesin-binding protein milt-like n=1 Tax=Tigriopus californicus TaxID=6832 RepID=UPI0027DAA854|nr:trafficking kinesin-binding protein milt-like [Tigriopus californicus]
MTKTYHDVEAVTRLLEEKEKDLELAAKIGQELLERNRFLEEKVFQLEAHIAQNNELITQLRHDLQIKTDLLRVYDADAADLDEASPLEIRNVSVDLLQRKIQEMQEENKKLHEEATELAKEAIEVEEKEEKLVSEAVKHLSDANVRISHLSEEFTCKVDESRKQKEEITHLLAKVCDMQSKVKLYSRDNEELRTSLCAYKETQEELTSELTDFKEKYREVVDLLHDAQDELKKSRKRTYPGLGQHSLPGMFTSGGHNEQSGEDGTKESSLLSEIHSSLRSSKRNSKKASRQSSKLDSASDFSDSDLDSRRFKGRSSNAGMFGSTFDTFRIATANSKMVHGGGPGELESVPVTLGYNPGQGSSLDKEYFFESYTVSRDNTASPDFMDLEFRYGELNPDDLDDGDDIPIGGMAENYVASGTAEAQIPTLGGHPGIGSLPGLGSVPSFGHLGHPGPQRGHQAPFSMGVMSEGVYSNDRDDPNEREESSNVLRVKTVGELSVPQLEMDALASPLGSVPSLSRDQSEPPPFGLMPLGGEPSTIPLGPLGSIPGGGGFAPSAGGLGSLPFGTVPSGARVGGSMAVDTFGASSLPGQFMNYDSSGGSRLCLTRDSGVTSSDFSDAHGRFSAIGDRQDNPGDGMSDDGRGSNLMGMEDSEFRGGYLKDDVDDMAELKFSGDSSSIGGGELDSVLKSLNPEEVERRRRQLSRTYSYDLGSDGFESPGSSLFGKPGFNFLPYGVRTPDSIMSTGSRDLMGSGGGSFGYYGAGWRLPDKLRIVKPLEGSLTLHNWQRLARPHLGNILEEREGVAMRGALPSVFSRSEDSDFDPLLLAQDKNLPQIGPKPDTWTLDTITNCTVLHPDETSAHTQLTSTYGGAQMSSGFGHQSRPSTAFSSRCSSRMSSRRQSISESGWRRSGTLTCSSNIGLAKVLNERSITGYLSDSTLRLDRSGVYNEAASIVSLTPSVISTPTGVRSFSPTGTPLNSPTHTPPGTPPNELEGSENGFVLGFFASLRSALYGEQKKEVHTLRHQRKRKQLKKLGILERVAEVGVENLLSSSPVPSHLSGGSRDSSMSREDSLSRTISDFDLRFMTTDIQSSELVDVEPGSLTLSRPKKKPLPPNHRESTPDPFMLTSRGAMSIPGLQSPCNISSIYGSTTHNVVGGRGPGRVIASPGDRRGAVFPGLGVPGQPGTGALLKSASGKPAERMDLGSVPTSSCSGGIYQDTSDGGFIGSITSMFFGRKGGLL